MKKILAIAIVAVSLMVFAVSARAESNPLLTVYEGIKVGSEGTSLTAILDAIHVYERDSSDVWGGLYRPFIRYSQKEDFESGKIRRRWQWTDKIFAKDDSANVKSPEALLEIVNDGVGKVFSVKYTYKFLDLEKTLSK